MERLKLLSAKKKEIQKQIEGIQKKIVEKQDVYRTAAEKRILKSGAIEQIKLSSKMSPEAVDEIENTVYYLKEQYAIMPKGIVYSPIKAPDATANYDWIDDKIYLSHRLTDSKEYTDLVKRSEYSHKEYRKHYNIEKLSRDRIEKADKIIADKSIKGYERLEAIVDKAEAEVLLNFTRYAVRENIRDTIVHEYGHFIHRHAQEGAIIPKNAYRMKDLGGKFVSGGWVYDRYSPRGRSGKILASKISEYATENPYETFAEGFLALDKGETISDSIADIIYDAMGKAGAKNIAKHSSSDIIKINNGTRYEGIPKTWKKLKKSDVSLNDVNPGYTTNDVAFRTNCPNCVSAYEMRRRGYDVIARPSGKNHYLNRNPQDAWINPDVKETKGSGLYEIMNAFETWPDNSRAEVSVIWTGRTNTGHVFVAEKAKGEIKFYDVQSGKTISEDIFDYVEAGKTKFWRIDNLDPSDRGITACKVGDHNDV